MRARRLTKCIAVMALAAMTATACGARVSPEQVAAARGTGVGGSPVATGGSPTGAVGVGEQGAAPAEGSIGVGADGIGASTGGANGSGGSTTQPGAASTQGPVDNGGATDVGLTATTMRVGQIATLSGPVPGLAQGAVFGMQAWAAYQNSLGGLTGRKIIVDVRDDQFDSGQYRSQTEDLIGKDLALVGSFSVVDDAGVEALERNKVVSIQVPLTPRLQQSPMNFSVNPAQRGAPTGPWNLFRAKFPEVVSAAAGLYTDVAAARENYLNNKAAAESVGYKFVYERGYAPTETDFTADIVRMRSAGVKLLWTNSDAKSVARIAKAFQAQNYELDVLAVGGAAYDGTFPPLAGDAGEGVFNIAAQAMYLGEDSPFNPEVKLFLEWLQKVKPGFQANLFAVYGWGAGRLFAKAVESAGPRLTRASLLEALRRIDNWDGYGLFAPVGPASKRPPTCFIIQIVRGGKFERWNSPPPGFNCTDSVFHRR